MPPEVRAALATGGATLLGQGNALGVVLLTVAIAATSDESGDD